MSASVFLPTAGSATMLLISSEIPEPSGVECTLDCEQTWALSLTTLMASKFESKERLRCSGPVSYTHLTLPTNREV